MAGCRRSARFSPAPLCRGTPRGLTTSCSHCPVTGCLARPCAAVVDASSSLRLFVMRHWRAAGSARFSPTPLPPWDAARSHDIMLTLSRDRMSRAVKPDRARLLLTLLRLFVSSSCVIGGLQGPPVFPRRLCRRGTPRGLTTSCSHCPVTGCLARPCAAVVDASWSLRLFVMRHWRAAGGPPVFPRRLCRRGTPRGLTTSWSHCPVTGCRVLSSPTVRGCC